MQQNQEFRLDNNNRIQPFSLESSDSVITIKQIAILSLNGKKANDWLHELIKQGLEVVIKYSNEQGQRVEYTHHFIPWVTQKHAKPVFDEHTIIIPSPEDSRVTYTSGSVEIFSKTPEVPFEVAFVFDALMGAEIKQKQSI
jgi:uncharacterized FAD-dependent dehydrogenase